MLELYDPFTKAWRSPRVSAVTSYHREELSKIFVVFAAADKMAKSARDTMSLSELFYMLKVGEMFDESLTNSQLISIFAKVNAISAEAGDDEDEQEIIQSR